MKKAKQSLFEVRFRYRYIGQAIQAIAIDSTLTLPYVSNQAS